MHIGGSFHCGGCRSLGWSCGSTVRVGTILAVYGTDCHVSITFQPFLHGLTGFHTSWSHLLLSALASTHLSLEPCHAPPSVSPNCFVHYIPRGRFTVWHYRHHSSTTSVGLAHPQLIMCTTQDDMELWILLSNHDLHEQSRQYGVQYLADRALKCKVVRYQQLNLEGLLWPADLSIHILTHIHMHSLSRENIFWACAYMYIPKGQKGRLLFY